MLKARSTTCLDISSHRMGANKMIIDMNTLMTSSNNHATPLAEASDILRDIVDAAGSQFLVDEFLADPCASRLCIVR